MTIFGLETLDLSSKNVVPSDFLHYFDEGTSPKAITRYRSPINFIFDSSECLDHFKSIFSIEIIWAPIWAPTYAVNLKTFLKTHEKTKDSCFSSFSKVDGGLGGPNRGPKFFRVKHVTQGHSGTKNHIKLLLRSNLEVVLLHVVFSKIESKIVKI